MPRRLAASTFYALQHDHCSRSAEALRPGASRLFCACATPGWRTKHASGAGRHLRPKSVGGHEIVPMGVQLAARWRSTNCQLAARCSGLADVRSLPGIRADVACGTCAGSDSVPRSARCALPTAIGCLDRAMRV